MAHQPSCILQRSYSTACFTRTGHTDISPCLLFLPCWFSSDALSGRERETVSACQVPGLSLPAGQGKQKQAASTAAALGTEENECVSQPD